MTPPVSISEKENKLAVGPLREENLSVPEIQSIYDQVLSDIKKSRPTSLEFDLSGLGDTDYGAIVLIRSLGDLATEYSVQTCFVSAGKEILESLARMGFGEDGSYIQKDFRTKPKPKSVYLTAGEATYKFFADIKSIIGFIGDLGIAFWELIKNPRKIPWPEILYYMDRTGADAVPIVALICFLMGLILGFQGIVQMGRFGIEVYVADLVGLAIIRELGPLMVAMICTGRAGSSFAAEVGTMKVNEELDAIQTMGLKPGRLLVVPKMVALVLVMPLLTCIGDVVGVIGGIFIAVTMGNVTVVEFCNRILQAVYPENLCESLLKSVVFAVLVAGVGCLRGFEAENDAKGVGNATTSSVVSGIFLIVLADATITFTFPFLVKLVSNG